MNIFSIVGARPQFIKLAPLSNLLKEYHRETIIHTGQHFDENMSHTFFDELEITSPIKYLKVESNRHGDQTAKMLIGIENILINEKPDLVIVFGDTNSTLAGVLASSKLNIKTVHVESGLRSKNRKMPEELNRIITDHASDYLFAPTEIALKNLNSEGLNNKSFLTGDIMVDSLDLALNRHRMHSIQQEYIDYYLLTLHRPYNVDDSLKLKKILSILSEMDETIIFPVHPRTKKIITSNDIKFNPDIKLINPLGYIDFISLMNNAKKIITDSGGIQKEAFILQKPCITLRSETEWVETVESGWNLLINVDLENNVNNKILNFNPNSKIPKIFGKNVADKMVKIINSIQL